MSCHLLKKVLWHGGFFNLCLTLALAAAVFCFNFFQSSVYWIYVLLDVVPTILSFSHVSPLEPPWLGMREKGELLSLFQLLWIAVIIQSTCNWKRPAGCSRTSWLATMNNNLSSHNLSVEDATELALDRPLCISELLAYLLLIATPCLMKLLWHREGYLVTVNSD